jgi:hypothetical protein
MTSRLHQAARAAVNAVDPAGLLMWAPEDEYDAEVRDLLGRTALTAEDVHAVFVAWFGAEDVQRVTPAEWQSIADAIDDARTEILADGAAKDRLAGDQSGDS